uniref:Uncharacterized protein n=1 Tax=Cyclophora tenuis TaxID=216820 RepID=A0A7S1GJZ7_CYCTE|mmetsp:Transcript_17891/g.30447  ORF Transcript_17891/g.30447 Transcript_17891/m.30447 type:complete len:181 (+) Transcript_17891:230-772(+)|eukprot:CAMPEP_0116563484 /NCGR_PEP_ID=MMETSP0397-20121206/12762_1 /TAXON_ID=216820 /ORGANISM="Cyclophora tenuis, Strain ECT3854" /LENGTH=180 /DNA_ID=CAMNT_0004089939 /DNA_START=357 /DNA_END=899 /DNA_ORIENTATION=-
MYREQMGTNGPPISTEKLVYLTRDSQEARTPAHNSRNRSVLSSSVNPKRTNHIKMMVARHLNHEFAAVEQPSASMDMRRRSNNIAINRSRHPDGNSHGASSNERMYDWATWKMYHRITSARKARTTVVPVEDGEVELKRQQELASVCDRTSQATPVLEDESESVSTLEEPIEGEVFQLDI